MRQSFVGNTTAVTGTGTVGGTTPADANTFDANTTGVNVTDALPIPYEDLKAFYQTNAQRVFKL